jgi:hypothetical protein
MSATPNRPPDEPDVPELPACDAPGGRCVGPPLCDGEQCPYASGAFASAPAERRRAPAPPAPGVPPVPPGVPPGARLVRVVEVRGDLWHVPIKGATAEAVDAGNTELERQILQAALHHDLIVAMATALLALNDPRIDRVFSAFAIQLKGPDGRLLWPKP